MSVDLVLLRVPEPMHFYPGGSSNNRLLAIRRRLVMSYVIDGEKLPPLASPGAVARKPTSA